MTGKAKWKGEEIRIWNGMCRCARYDETLPKCKSAPFIFYPNPICRTPRSLPSQGYLANTRFCFEKEFIKRSHECRPSYALSIVHNFQFHKRSPLVVLLRLTSDRMGGSTSWNSLIISLVQHVGVSQRSSLGFPLRRLTSVSSVKVVDLASDAFMSGPSGVRKM